MAVLNIGHLIVHRMYQKMTPKKFWDVTFLMHLQALYNEISTMNAQKLHVQNYDFYTLKIRVFQYF